MINQRFIIYIYTARYYSGSSILEFRLGSQLITLISLEGIC
ncbi:hypothetical protein IFVP408_C290482 [Vibrio parahaemolyticus]